MAGEPVEARGGGRRELVRRFTVRRRGWRCGLLWVAAGLAELAVLAPVVFQRDVPIAPLDVVLRLIGGSFAACGLIAWQRRPDSRSGLWMTATGFGFLVPALLRDLDSELAQTAGHWLSDAWSLFFIPLLLTYQSSGRLRTRAARLLVGAVVLEVAVLAPLWLFFADEPATLLTTFPNYAVAGAVDSVQRVLYVAISVGTAAVVGIRWRRASAPGRRAMLPSLAGAVCLLLWATVLTVDLTIPGPRWALLLSVTAWSLVTVPLAFLAGLLRSRLARGGLADLFGRMRMMQPAQLQSALARVLHDPAFAIAHPGDDGRLVGVDGRPVELPVDRPGAESDRAVTVVQRDGVTVATLIYDRSLADDPELIEAVGGAATIALENRTLLAEAETRLAELQASRERIVTAADAERRRIERNLHDGAQQRLVTLALQLSLIQRRIRDNPGAAEELVASASDELALSLAELRELARGIHPAALEQGLPNALEALALRSAVPVRLEVEPGPRWPRPVEFAAYFVASEALANVAKYAQASTVTVRVAQPGADAVIEITDDGVGGADPDAGSGLRGLADRVEALGGRFRVRDGPTGGTQVVAELPLRAQSSTLASEQSAPQ
jgi:signal transduction histidine kinase